VADLARRQYGVVTRTQLRTIGLGRRAIELRIANGRLHVVHRGVYAVGHALMSREARWMAAVLAAGPGAVLSHASAAAHLGIRPPGAVTTDITIERLLRSRPGIRLHYTQLPPDEVMVHEAIPVTTPTRTLFDLAGWFRSPSCSGR